MAKRPGRSDRQRLRAFSGFDMDQATKQPFSIDQAIPLIRTAVAGFPKAAMFELYERGYTSLFEQLIACMISVRTYDEVTLPTSIRLFARARTAEQMLKLTVAEIDTLIVDSTYHEAKSFQIRAIAERAMKEFGGELPASFEVLTSLKGVGPKCANLALGVAAKQERISVDIHVHRVTNRWGYVQAATPEKTLVELEKVLPRAYWVEINKLLVPFGKHVCTGTLPKCSTCPLRTMCKQVGVKGRR
jgi:endonuclease-3